MDARSGSDFELVLKTLLQLKSEAIAAYEESIMRFEQPQLKAKLCELAAEHKNHFVELKRLAGKLNIEVKNDIHVKSVMMTSAIKPADEQRHRAWMNDMARMLPEISKAA